MQKFVTLFAECEDVHLKKDVGMIPYVLGKHFQYDSSIACFGKAEDYPSLQKELSGLKHIELTKKFGSQQLGVLSFLWKNAAQIGVLNVYHMNLKKGLFWGWFYKLRNKKGCVYLKLDMGEEGIGLLQTDSNIKKSIKNRFLNSIDYVSAESHYIISKLENLWHRKVEYVPNGFYDFENQKENITVEKEKIILTVGRLGTKPKATEILLEAFANSEYAKKEYKLRLVGPIEKEFESYIEEYFKRYPELKNVVEFTGPINDPVQLKHEYEKAAIFCLPSRWESFGIVLVEALCNGCFICVSDGVAPCKDVTCDEKYGKIFAKDDAKALATCLDEIEQEKVFEKMTPEFCSELSEFGEREFSWIAICKKLNSWFKMK